jgi:hypothetical protein
MLRRCLALRRAGPARGRPVAGTAAVREITLGWSGSLELENSRMNALAVATFAGLDASTPHGRMTPPFRRAGSACIVLRPARNRRAILFLQVVWKPSCMETKRG